MSIKLSFNTISATLATLGATTLVACGGASPDANSPVDAKEVPASADGEKEASCGAGTCGANQSKDGGEGSCGADHQGGEGSCGATDSQSSSSGPMPAPEPTEVAEAGEATPANDTGPSAAPSQAVAPPPTSKPASPKAKPRPRQHPKRAAAAEAACGQGTCG